MTKYVRTTKSTNPATKISIINAQTKSFPNHLQISRRAESIMDYLVAEFSTEVSWYGFIKRVETDNGFYLELYDIVVPSQEVAAASTDILEDDYGKFVSDMISAGRTDELINRRFWGHSHVKMGVTPSSTDETEFLSSYNTVLSDHSPKFEGDAPFYIMWIQNKSGAVTCDLIYDSVRFHGFSILYESQIIDLPDDIDIAHLKKDVVRQKYQTHNWGTNNKYPYGNSNKQHSHNSGNSKKNSSHKSQETKKNTMGSAITGAGNNHALATIGIGIGDNSIESDIHDFPDYDADYEYYTSGNKDSGNIDSGNALNDVLPFSTYLEYMQMKVEDIDKTDYSILYDHYNVIEYITTQTDLNLTNEDILNELMHDFYTTLEDSKTIQETFIEFGVKVPKNINIRQCISALAFYSNNEEFIDDIGLYVLHYEHLDNFLTDHVIKDGLVDNYIKNKGQKKKVG